MEALIDEILKGDFQRLGTVEVLRQFASMSIVLLLGVLAGVFFINTALTMCSVARRVMDI